MKEILESTRIPEDASLQLPWGKASMKVEYIWGNMRVHLSVVLKIQNKPELYHNRPEIVIISINTDTVYVLKAAIAQREIIKRQK